VFGAVPWPVFAGCFWGWGVASTRRLFRHEIPLGGDYVVWMFSIFFFFFLYVLVVYFHGLSL
jgi:hypothetical protein